MKKAKVLLGIFISILILPFTVLAEENQKVNVYFFYGDGCSYCAQAEEFFNSIEDEYGDHYNLVMYETWNNSDNVDLMNEVADLRKEEPEGVPYIIIGDQSWQGYTSSYDEEIISKIETDYNTAVDERYDIMNYIDDINPELLEEKGYASDIAAVIAIILVVAAFCVSIGYARKKAN